MLDEILPYALVPGHAGVFVCGCFERWVSIQLQAIRGHNLAWALIETKRLVAGQRAAVIGGGFAGLSAAAALGRKGVLVTLFERAPALLATQRHNHTRWIHPHIHEWPRPGSRNPRAGLPLLDWHAGLAADMAAEVLNAFAVETARSKIEVRSAAGAVTLGEGPSVSGERFDAVVLALGVGVEKTFGALPLASYWTDADIGTVRPGPARHHLVTGIGEGGVIDTLYLRLAGFSHAELADRLAEVEGMAAIEQELLTIERELEGRGDVDANAHLHARHAGLAVPAAVDALLKSRLRPDTRVTLNGPEAFALAPRADLFNRFILSRLLRLGGLEYVAGAVEDVSAEGAGWQVKLSSGRVLHVDRVNVRHGTVPSLAAAFPEIWAAYAPVRRGLPHLTPRPAWPAGYFG
ncbi:MAG: FAD-dependent oxidoreductase [Archangium sp.]|nr:FAD-dependent oxidoreductase [Archangium sp.]